MMKKLLKNPTYKISILILSLSVLFWITLFFDPFNLLGGQSCHVEAGSVGKTSMSGLMIGWILMVFAMMLPKLIIPLEHIYHRSLKRKRFSSSLFFILGYAFVWTVVGYFMNLAILAFDSIVPGSYLPALIIGFIALVWQFSPIKQYFLNLGHDHRSIKAFGWSASGDAFKFGIEHGISCFGSGWALMWFPMLLPVGHNIAMLLVMFIMISEHMEHPKVPRWRIIWRMKLWNIISAQARMRMGY